jgi:L-iditol 2-dehydrogenase
LDVARNCGIDFIVNVSFENLDAKVEEFFGQNGADAILECVGVEDTIAVAIHLARKGTDIVVVGVFGGKPSVDIGLVQDKELRVIGTLMYKAEDYRVAIDLIQSRKINLEPLISQHFPFEDYPEAFAFIEKHQDEVMKVLIDL